MCVCVYCVMCMYVYSGLPHTKTVALPVARSGKTHNAWNNCKLIGLLDSRVLNIERLDSAEILLETSALHEHGSQSRYEYTDRTLSGGWWDSKGENWPPALICQG